MARTISIYHVPAGYPLSGVLKLKMKAGGSTTWTDVTNPSDVPSTKWYLNFVDDNNKALFSYPKNDTGIDWSTIDPNNPWIVVYLSGADTLTLKGKMLHLEISNEDGVSDLITPPDDYFNFVPNKIPPMTKTVQTVS